MLQNTLFLTKSSATEQKPSSSFPVQSTSLDIMPFAKKRKRASKACLSCQAKHTKCGSERPCTRCKKYGLHCVDSLSTKKRGRTQKKKLLEDAKAHLEFILQTMNFKLDVINLRNQNLFSGMGKMITKHVPFFDFVSEELLVKMDFFFF